MIVSKNRAHVLDLPPVIPDVERVSSLNIFGVVMQQDLSVSEPVDNIVNASGQNLYALKVLKVHGLKTVELRNVCRAKLSARHLMPGVAIQR